jgi:hypothetical protein
VTTHFITAEIDLKENPLTLQRVIEAELEKQGQPLRWAIAQVAPDGKKVQVEAIITK